MRARLSFALGIALLSWTSASAGSQLPPLDLEAMEPQVAAKIRSHIAAVESMPERSDEWGALGAVLQAHGLEAEAAECYQEAISRDASDFRWQYLLVHALRAEDAARALEQSAKALEVDDTYPPLLVLRAELLEQSGELDEARTLYLKALSLESTSGMAAFGAGRLLASAGELERALELLKRAAELNPDAGAIHGALARVHRRLGDRDAATAAAKLASERTGNVGIADPLHFQMRQESVSSLAQLDRAQRAVDAGELQRAESIYRELVALRPDDADMLARLGDLLAQRERLDEAETFYRKALSANPEHAWSLFGLGNLEGLRERYDAAIELYRQSIEKRPEHPQTRINLARVLAFRGALDEAVSELTQAVALEPGSFEAQQKLGEVLILKRDAASAIPHLEAAIEIDPRAGRAHFQLAMALAERGRFEEALGHVREAERLGETVAPGLVRELQSRAKSP